MFYKQATESISVDAGQSFKELVTSQVELFIVLVPCILVKVSKLQTRKQSKSVNFCKLFIDFFFRITTFIHPFIHLLWLADALRADGV